MLKLQTWRKPVIIWIRHRNWLRLIMLITVMCICCGEESTVLYSGHSSYQKGVWPPERAGRRRKCRVSYRKVPLSYFRFYYFTRRGGCFITWWCTQTMVPPPPTRRWLRHPPPPRKVVESKVCVRLAFNTHLAVSLYARIPHPRVVSWRSLLLITNVI